MYTFTCSEASRLIASPGTQRKAKLRPFQGAVQAVFKWKFVFSPIPVLVGFPFQSLVLINVSPSNIYIYIYIYTYI